MNFLFPSDYFQKTKPDEIFQEQFETFQKAGFDCFVSNIEEEGPVYPKKEFAESELLIYRGFMLSPDEYSALHSRMIRAGAQPLTSPADYELCHHLPNWYPLIKDFSPETIICRSTSEAVDIIEKLDWDAFFIKDFVKSLKTSIGSMITDKTQIPIVLAEMEKFRGTIEGGICIRKAENWKTETEIRAFVLNGKPFIPAGAAFPDALRPAIEAIRSPFFSLDFVSSLDGNLRIVEIGDGQVSDLVGWSTSDFLKIFEHGA